MNLETVSLSSATKYNYIPSLTMFSQPEQWVSSTIKQVDSLERLKIGICKFLGEVFLKTEGEAWGLEHFPRALAIVDERQKHVWPLSLNKISKTTVKQRKYWWTLSVNLIIISYGNKLSKTCLNRAKVKYSYFRTCFGGPGYKHK